MGPAAAGTQVYICTQPAVTTTVPPSPLAFVFVDNAGVMSLTQPLVCDGFGHASAYLASGVYTVVIVNGGVTQQVLLDQAIGSAGGGNAPGGHTGDIQFNVLGSFGGLDSFSIDSTTGEVVLLDAATAATGFAALSVFGNAKGDDIQDWYTTGSSLGEPEVWIDNDANLHLSAGLYDSVSSIGTLGQFLSSTVTGIKWVSAPSGPSFTTAGQGFFFGGQSYGPVDAGYSSVNTSNVVYVVQLNLSASYTIRKLTEYTVTANDVSGYVIAGIYSIDGNTKLIDSGANAFQSSIHSEWATTVTLATPVVIGPGTYWFAFAGYGSGGILCHNLNIYTGALLNGYQFGSGFSNPIKFGTAANPSSAGALPATLGTITGLDYGNAQLIPAIAFMV
jgi:hypothetical protein